jgi:2-phosphoglycerate kinase
MSSALMAPQPRWHVLLVGGASGVGKTTLAHGVGRHYGVNVTQIDDIQAALEAVTTPEQQPDLHFWRTNWDDFSRFTDQEHLEHFIHVARTLFTPVITAVLTDRLDGGLPTIIEGGFILPELAESAESGRLSNGGRVRALFVDEAKQDQFETNFVERQGGDGALPARTSWLKARWLRHECERLSLATINARPWDTALSRAIATLTLTSRH